MSEKRARRASSEATHRSEVAARYQEEESRDAMPRTREEARDVNRYDIRRVIGGLLAIYGAVLFIAGFFISNEKANDVPINTYTGLGMMAVGLAMVFWALKRPVVREEELSEER
jgi:uncharacterized membrane protein